MAGRRYSQTVSESGSSTYTPSHVVQALLLLYILTLSVFLDFLIVLIKPVNIRDLMWFFSSQNNLKFKGERK